jgi:hypothetical protein
VPCISYKVTNNADHMQIPTDPIGIVSQVKGTRLLANLSESRADGNILFLFVVKHGPMAGVAGKPDFLRVCARRRSGRDSSTAHNSGGLQGLCTVVQRPAGKVLTQCACEFERSRQKLCCLQWRRR